MKIDAKFKEKMIEIIFSPHISLGAETLQDESKCSKFIIIISQQIPRMNRKLTFGNESTGGLKRSPCVHR